MQTCLCDRKDLESSFHHCGGPVQLVQACLSVRMELESSFDHCGGLLRLVPACLNAGKRSEAAVLTSVEELLSTCRPV